MPRLFLGNLGHDVRTRDIEKLFKGYGEVKNVNIKGKFGFIEIEDEGDAEDAIKDLDGKSFNGGRIRIEFSNAYSGDYGGSSSSRGSSRREKSVDMDGRRFSDGRFRKSDYRVIVDNLSSRTSWQDLKDFMSEAGDVVYTSVKRPKQGEGLVEFGSRSAMEYAIKNLDDTKLDGNYIRVDKEKSRSRSRRRSRSRSGSSRSLVT